MIKKQAKLKFKFRWPSGLTDEEFIRMEPEIASDSWLGRRIRTILPSHHLTRWGGLATGVGLATAGIVASKKHKKAPTLITQVSREMPVIVPKPKGAPEGKANKKQAASPLSNFYELKYHYKVPKWEWALRRLKLNQKFFNDAVRDSKKISLNDKKYMLDFHPKYRYLTGLASGVATTTAGYDLYRAHKNRYVLKKPGNSQKADAIMDELQAGKIDTNTAKKQLQQLGVVI